MIENPDKHKLKQLEKIYPVRNHGIQMRKNKKLEKLLKLDSPSGKRLVSNGVYSPKKRRF